MTAWWLLAILSGIGLAGRNVLLKMSGLKIDGAVAALVMSLVMATAAIGYYVLQRSAARLPLIPHEQDATGLWLAAGAGVSLAAANIFLVYTYKAGGGAGLTAILQNGVSLGLTILIGALLLNEVIRPIQALGAMTALIGILMIVKG